MATRISKIFVISRFSILGIVPIIFDENLFNSSSSVMIGGMKKYTVGETLDRPFNL